jgi:two-component system NarL family sensor kinase
VQALLCAQQDLKVARRGRAEYIDRADHALDDAVRRLRHEIFQLHPHVLETAGLQTALAAVAAQGVLPDAAPPVVTVAPDAAGVDDELLFSLGRELLTNVARHAGARHVELTVERAGESLVLRCRDDGRGMAPERRGAALAGGHLGLAACTERVEAVGGTLELRSEVGAGTEVRATVPVAGRGDGRAGTPPAMPAPRSVVAQGLA